MSSTHEPDDRHLVRYLIGSLAEDETERLDEQSIADDQFAARLTDVENDLVDAFVAGALSGDTLERFKTHYLSSPAAREKVGFAEALRRHQQRAAAVPSRAAEGRRGFTVPRLVPQWGWAVAALLFLGVSGYLLVDNSRLRRQMIDARSALGAREQQLQQQVIEQRSANAETARELARIRESLAQRPPADADRPAARTVLASLVLLPPRRGGGDIPAVTISPADAVRLHVDLESDDFPVYRAELKDARTGGIVWRGANLRAGPRAGARSLSITLEPGVLKPQTYTVEVTGVPAGATAELIGSYPFRAVGK